jgi:hypothetical protein
MIVAMLGAAWPDEDTPLAAIGAVAVLTGLASGACTGAITGWALRRLLMRGLDDGVGAGHPAPT